MSYSMYTRFDLKNGQDEQGLIKALESMGYEFEVSRFSTEIFLKEEAEMRLDMYEENNEVEVSDDVRIKVIEDIAYSLFNDEYVIDSERVDDVVADTLKDWVEHMSCTTEYNDYEERGTIFVDESSLM